jgi:hypothetical protein
MGMVLRALDKMMSLSCAVQVIEDEPAILRPRVRRYTEDQPLFWLSRRDPVLISDGPHIGIFGESGSGKTNAGNFILASITASATWYR